MISRSSLALAMRVTDTSRPELFVNVAWSFFVICAVPKVQTSCVVCRIAAGADAVACVFHSSMELIHGGASIAM